MTQLSLGLDRDDRSAVISPCGLYRYRLGRRWSDGPAVMFLMLNPSVADAEQPDPTMTRCVNYAKAWGYPALVIGNLFALRSTDPKALYRAADPIGPDNDRHLVETAAEAGLIIGAWGNNGLHMGRDVAVRRLIPGMKALAFTGLGQPGHPLYLRGDLVSVDFPEGKA